MPPAGWPADLVFPRHGLMPGPRPERLGGYFVPFAAARRLTEHLGIDIPAGDAVESYDAAVKSHNSYLPRHFENHFVERGGMPYRAAEIQVHGGSAGVGGVWFVSSFVDFSGAGDPGPLREETEDVDRALRAWMSEYRVPAADVQRNDRALRAWLRVCGVPNADVRWVSLEDTAGITATPEEVTEMLRQSMLNIQAAKAKYFAELQAKALAENT
ncbi:hypothetical protein BJ138DRAFT_1165011 [Hygrophoropsis aurantiaca]|uniref:Uncharacterized protein n=1 Tax=Hygrophoropsis aurantiaca TaxID=72124 RepID=A0ACB7ZXB7_9AGAM|nr:hypothetical protein BJ138DRAFT_1165011 [Hygrophoropsis aurantiaca]